VAKCSLRRFRVVAREPVICVWGHTKQGRPEQQMKVGMSRGREGRILSASKSGFEETLGRTYKDRYGEEDS